MREENFVRKLGMRRGHAGAYRAAGGGGWAPQELGAGVSPRPICTQWDGLGCVGVWPSGSEALTPGRQGGWTQRREKTLCRETSGQGFPTRPSAVMDRPYIHPGLYGGH